MGKIMKAGKVVLTLGGRYAGRKAVVVKVIIKLKIQKSINNHKLI
jgi:ribosomal protein L14E/L6E/L27E